MAGKLDQLKTNFEKNMIDFTKEIFKNDSDRL